MKYNGGVATAVASLLVWWAVTDSAAAADVPRPCVGGRYPHLAMLNHGQECGIGAVVPWADRLWAVTYPPHAPRGSDDKLYEISPNLDRVTRPESIGGTPANRLIHRESRQLFIGPYVIDDQRNVRVIPYQKALGRPTATMRHLTDPANKVYTFTMEEGLYEIDVHTLEVKTVHPDSHAEGFVDYLPGYHGKGGYTGQGRVVVANNGRKAGADGCLAQWDGHDWQVVARHQFNEVTGPGGIHGNARDDDPIWATGWDRRSVILKLLDHGTWYTFRLPIADDSYLARHGWYTEWPRIRQAGPAGQYLMSMHGLWFDFPKTFSAKNTGSLRPIASYLKVTADFCHWRQRLVFGCDDTAITGGNRLVNQSQSNLWFTTWDRLGRCGRPAGWGCVWVDDDVRADVPSDPFHFAGYEHRVVHLSHQTDAPVTFTIELDRVGDGHWAALKSITVPARGYTYHVFDHALPAEWVRIRADRDGTGVTACFHYGPGGGAVAEPDLATAVADIDFHGTCSSGIVRPRGGDLGTLQFLAYRDGLDTEGDTESDYYEMGPELRLRRVQGHERSVAYLKKIAGLPGADFLVDAASAIVQAEGRRYRLPVSHREYKHPWSTGWPRGVREVVTERRLLNCCGTFYVLPHDDSGGIAAIKPVCTHNKRITDFCSWRGMLVLAGTRDDARPDGHFIKSDNGQAGLWLGDIDDLWRLGKPRGEGGPWRDTPVRAREPSDPYLMTGFDRKSVTLSHDANHAVVFRLQVDVLGNGRWKSYVTVKVAPDEAPSHEFPDGFSARWVRVVTDRDCRATAWFVYR